MQALIDYLETLEVTQGEGVGKPFPLFPWERKFIKGAFSGRGQASLTVARGNGKTTLLSGVAAASVDPSGPLTVRRGRPSLLRPLLSKRESILSIPKPS